jgi:predicted Zn-dependent protease
MAGPNTKLFAMNLAQLYMESGRGAAAESLLTGMVQKSPEDFEAAYTLAEFHQRRGDLRKTREVLSEWLAQNPAHQYAAMVAQQVQQLETQMRMAPPPALPPPPGSDSNAPAVQDTGHPPGGAGKIPGL